MRSNGRGIYHGSGLHKNDMVIHQDHRGRWRIDLVTSTGGNHIDVTEREPGSSPNSGYGSAESAFTAALGIQRKRGLYGKTNVFVPDGDEYKLYEPEGAHLPFERNGRNEIRYVRMGQVERGPNYQWQDGYSEGGNTQPWVTKREAQADARSRGAKAVFVEPDTLERNGRATVADPTAARELSLYIENEYALIGAPNSIGKNIDAGLRRKVASGKYDSALAPKAWQYLIEEGAKRYTKEFGTSGDFIFNAATRRQVAEEFARAWEAENPHR